MNHLKRLQNALERFAPANTVSGLTKQFEDIAQIVFNGRYVVNGEYEIYPIDIEFYFHDEENKSIIEPQMYHVGDVPYFPVGAICPNRSGVDMTFEREGKYRASFLIRGYTYKSLVNNDEKTFTNKASQKLKEGEIDKFKPHIYGKICLVMPQFSRKGCLLSGWIMKILIKFVLCLPPE